MGKKKIVIDTNIFISALGWEGNSRELMRRAVDNEYELFVSECQLDEIRKVLDYPKFRFSRHEKDRFLADLLEISHIVHIKAHLTVSRDKDDDMIIECAVESNSDYIITGDADLLSLKEFNGIKMIKIRDFLNIP